MEKIALCGASGSGKTTLAKEISAKFNIPYISMSQNGKFEHQVIERFRFLTENQYRVGLTHSQIINLSHRFPLFGVEFQVQVLNMRSKMILENDRFVTDRSPIDCIVYFLAQVSNYCTDPESERFIDEAKLMVRKLDKIILLSPNPNGPVEDDGMRIPNQTYQGFIHGIFEYVFNQYFSPPFNHRVLYIREWDWNTRVDLISYFLKT